jgi:quercetin dioxygenase-like cupin family protein
MAMRLTKTRLAVAMIAAAAPFAFLTPGQAAQAPAATTDCPGGGTNALTGAPTMPMKVTDDIVGSIDLNSEIGVDNRDLRLRRLVVQPGGVVPLHSHKGRPALITVVSGQITEYRSSCAAPIVHKAGDVAREAEGISHWWRNEGREPAVLLSADVKARD